MDRSPETDMLSELPRLEWRKMECLLLRSTKELTWVALYSTVSVNEKSSFVLLTAVISYPGPPPANHTLVCHAGSSKSVSGMTLKVPEESAMD